MIPCIAITPGDPRGIGFEIVLKALQQNFPARFVIFGDQTLLEKQAKKFNLSIDHLSVECVHIPYASSMGDYIIETLTQAVRACKDQRCEALVTGPVHKASVIESGYPDFRGHTDFLKTLDQADDVVMLLASDQCRVALITTHIPLADVAHTLTAELLEKKLKIIHHDFLHRFHYETPRLHVAGLNPHAGESGHLGLEEITIITPVIAKLKHAGLHVEGPFPADTLFTETHLKCADVMVAMYHDQGLAPLKALSFGHAVNISLGLSFLRTSVDHGTAYDIAGLGIANPQSMIEAIRWTLK